LISEIFRQQAGYFVIVILDAGGTGTDGIGYANAKDIDIFVQTKFTKVKEVT
jgi:hypothetical protein